MKFSHIKPEDPGALFSHSESAKKSAFNEKHESLENRFKALQDAQNALERLGHLLIVGQTQSEAVVVDALSELKRLIYRASPEAVDKQLSVVEAHLEEYGNWIEQSNHTLCPYGLRQYIKQDRLTREDALALALYICNARSVLEDERGKFEMLFAKLFREADKEEKELFSAKLFQNPPQHLTDLNRMTIEQLRALAAKIDSFALFSNLIEKGSLIQARILKQALGTALWLPEGISAVDSLNGAIGHCFQKHFIPEQQLILRICSELLAAEIYSLDELECDSSMSVEAAAKLAEEIGSAADENYRNKIKLLQQFARVSHWMRYASDMLAQNSKTDGGDVKRKKSPYGPVIGPETFDPPMDDAISPYGANVVEMEQRIEEIIQEIRRLVMELPNQSVGIIHLKHIRMALSRLEVEAFASQGQMAESTLQIHQYNLIRRSLAIIAEQQENAVILEEATRSGVPLHSSDPIAINYLMEQNQKAQNELEVMSQTTREQGDAEASVALLALRRKLQQAYQLN